MTQKVYPEQNLQTVQSLDQFREKSIDYTNRFEESLKDFAEALGISRLFPVAEGMTIKFYDKPEVTLADGKVAEGDLIPLSHVTPKPHSSKVIELLKYRKATSGEAIQRYGLSQAINLTDEALIKEIQKNTRTELFNLIQSGEEKPALPSESTFQGALASAWGNLNVIFEDDEVRTIVFANPMDVAEAIADKKLTLENAFGLNYYTDLTGTVVFTSNQVAMGNIYSTAAENLVIAYIPPQGSDLGRAFNLTTDNTGFIGMTHFVEPESLTHQTLVVSGVLMYPERLDGVIKIPLAPVVP